MKALQVICGFPGVGKTTLVKKYYNLNDSDSSHFDKSNFPANYVRHIRSIMERGETTFVSTHGVVRQALQDAGISYGLVYPARELKEDYMARYVGRDSPDAFVKMMDRNWDKFIDECENDPTPFKLKMTAFDQNLEDVISITPKGIIFIQ